MNPSLGVPFLPWVRPRVVARPPPDETIVRPGLSAIEARPHPNVLAAGQVGRRRAEEKNIAIVTVYPQERSLAAIDVRRAVEELIILLKIPPGLATVVAVGDPAIALSRVRPGVDVNRAVAQLDESRLACPVEGKGSLTSQVFP